MRNIHKRILQSYLLMKRNKQLIHTTTQMTLNNSMSRERSQTWKTTCCMIPCSTKFPEKAKRKRHKVDWCLLGRGGWNKTDKADCKVKLRWWQVVNTLCSWLHKRLNVIKISCILTMGEFYGIWNYSLIKNKETGQLKNKKTLMGWGKT